MNNGLFKVEMISLFINLNQMALKVTGEKNSDKKTILATWEGNLELWTNSLGSVTVKYKDAMKIFIKLQFRKIREAADKERKKFEQIAEGRVGLSLRVSVIVS